MVGKPGSFGGFGTIGGSGLTGLVGDPGLNRGSRLVGDSDAFEKTGLVDDPGLVKGQIWWRMIHSDTIENLI